MMALLLAMGAALPEARAGDGEDCENAEDLVQWKLKPAEAVVAACRRLAERGVIWAPYELGYFYATGEIVPQDYAEAARWYRKASDQGMAAAQYELGYFYATGRGVPLDNAEAVRWYRKAADQGHFNAQVALGVMYEFGQGVPQDYVQAYVWYKLAEAGGKLYDAAWRRYRDSVAAKMTPAQIEQAKALAAAWKPTTGK
jgi:TPR repeat protein